MISIVLSIFGILCIFYDFALIVSSPGTFLDNLTSFSHIWTLIGGYHIFLGIYRKKNWTFILENLEKMGSGCCVCSDVKCGCFFYCQSDFYFES